MQKSDGVVVADVLGIFLLRSFPDACLHSIRAMIVKQGIVVTEAGKGELNAALSGLGQIAGIVMPGFFWGPLFRFFAEGGGSASATRLRAVLASQPRQLPLPSGRSTILRGLGTYPDRCASNFCFLWWS